MYYQGFGIFEKIGRYLSLFWKMYYPKKKLSGNSFMNT